MAEILDRHGHKVKISICSSTGQTREIASVAEFKRLAGGIRSNLLQIFLKSLARGNFKNIYILGKIFTKKYILHREYDERHDLINTAFDIASVKIWYNGMDLTFTQGGFLMFVLLDQIFIGNEYDVSPENIRGKTVVDAGANLGTFSLMCAALGAKKVYAFEPVKGTYEMLKKNIEDNGLQHVIIPVNKALGEGNYETQIRSDYAGDGGSSIGLSGEKPKMSQNITVISLDSFFAGKEERVDVIKADVEGYEENVLIGAKATISKFKPILALSAYHKPTDKVAIPKLIREIRPDYNIKVNNFYEEDFYCD